MLKCQTCDQPATHHVTEMVAGEPREYHLCEKHVQDLENLPPPPKSLGPGTGFQRFWNDSKLGEILQDPAVRQEIAAHVLPALGLGLLNQKPEVRVAAVFDLMRLGPEARSAADALRDALKDPDERVAKAAQIALEYIQSDRASPWFEEVVAKKRTAPPGERGGVSPPVTSNNRLTSSYPRANAAPLAHRRANAAPLAMRLAGG
jgi:hypothetical protein